MGLEYKIVAKIERKEPEILDDYSHELRREGIETLKGFIMNNPGYMEGKLVGFRADTNVVYRVANDKLSIYDDKRISEVIPDMKLILREKGKIVFIFHVEDKQKTGGTVFKDNQLIAKRISEYLGQAVIVRRIEEPNFWGSESEQKIRELKNGAFDVLILQNIRLNERDRILEKGNKSELILPLVEHLDLFVDAAPDSMHRCAASLVEIKYRMKEEQKPVMTGTNFGKTYNPIRRLIREFEAHPRKSIATLGGSKIGGSEGKLEILNTLLDLHIHKIIISGKMVHPFFVAQGKSIGAAKVADDEVALAKKIIENADNFGVTLIFPRDFITVPESACPYIFESMGKPLDQDRLQIEVVKEIPKGRVQLDIGPESQQQFYGLIISADFRLGNGPTGVAEFKEFSAGTYAIARAFRDVTYGFGAIGGGDTGALIAPVFNKSTEHSVLLRAGGAILGLVAAKGNTASTEAMKGGVPKIDKNTEDQTVTGGGQGI